MEIKNYGLPCVAGEATKGNPQEKPQGRVCLCTFAHLVQRDPQTCVRSKIGDPILEVGLVQHPCVVATTRFKLPPFIYHDVFRGLWETCRSDNLIRKII